MDWSGLPPLSMLRAFEAAARHGGFSAAGRELNVTHAAVSQQVRGLEGRLGVTLMRRDGRGLSLTVEGRALADQLGHGLDTMRRALSDLLDADAARPLRVTLTPKFSAFWLMPRIGRFRAHHPEIELLFSPSAEVVDLQRADFDLGIRFGDGDWPGHAATMLVPSAVVVVATPALLQGHRMDTPSDLLALPWVQETETQEWTVWLAAHGVKTGAKRDVLHLPGYMALTAMREGQGVGLTARALVEDDLATGRLVALFDEHAARATGYFLVHRPGPLRAPARTFVDWLLAEAAPEQPAARHGAHRTMTPARDGSGHAG